MDRKPSDCSAAVAGLNTAAAKEKAAAFNGVGMSPIYGHGFGPPGVVVGGRGDVASALDLSSSQSPQPLPEDWRHDADGGCSRTIPRLPQGWLHKLERRARIDSAAAVAAVSGENRPTPIKNQGGIQREPTPPQPPVSAKRSACSIPVGIAVARQRTESVTKTSATPAPQTVAAAAAAAAAYPSAPAYLDSPSIAGVSPDVLLGNLTSLNYHHLAAGRILQRSAGYHGHVSNWAPWQGSGHGDYAASMMWPQQSDPIYGFPYAASAAPAHPPSPAHPLLLIRASCLGNLLPVNQSLNPYSAVQILSNYLSFYNYII